MSTEESKSSPFPSPLTRRIVTGHGESGESKVLYDDDQGHVTIVPNGNRLQTVWLTDEVPAELSSETNTDPTINKNFLVANDGSVCTIACMKPGTSSPMHRTKSIDYGVIIEGEVELELENGDKRLLKAGDVVVQRGTKHAWHNRHPTKTMKVFSVIIASKD